MLLLGARRGGGNINVTPRAMARGGVTFKLLLAPAMARGGVTFGTERLRYIWLWRQGSPRHGPRSNIHVTPPRGGVTSMLLLPGEE